VKAKDIMTTPVTTIRPDTRVPEIASILLRQRISGVPVVERGRVVGMVSEGDLVRRHEIGTERKRFEGSWWTQILHGNPGPGAYVKSRARRAADIMTRPAVCVADDLPAAAIAALFEKHRIKRVPVLVEGKLAGIVTRADLVRALAATLPADREERAQSDEAIRKQLLGELSSQTWWHPASHVIVRDGVVRYEGLYDGDEARAAAHIAAENVPGVKRIVDNRISTAEFPTMG
jgi:CBS domain-containing protein